MCPTIFCQLQFFVFLKASFDLFFSILLFVFTRPSEEVRSGPGENEAGQYQDDQKEHVGFMQ